MKRRIAARPGYTSVDGKTIYVDSQGEAKLIGRLVRQGFSKRWKRRSVGVVSGKYRYTSDFELSVNHRGSNMRAIVETKPYKSALTKGMIRRMIATAAAHRAGLLTGRDRGVDSIEERGRSNMPLLRQV